MCTMLYVTLQSCDLLSSGVMIFWPDVGGPASPPIKMKVSVSEYCVAGESPVMVAFNSPSAPNTSPLLPLSSTDAFK